MHRFKIRSTLIILIAFLLLSELASRAQTTTVTVDPPSMTVSLSDPLTLEISVKNVTDLHAARVTIAFANSLLQYAGVTAGDFLARNGGNIAFFSNPPANSGTNTVTVEQAILGLSTVSGSGVLFSIHFTALAAGTSQIEITALDLRNGSDPPGGIPAVGISGQVIVNAPPVITSRPPLTALQDQIYEYQVLALDPEGDPLSYSLTVAPAFLAIDTSMGTIRGAPRNADVGEHGVAVQASDNRGSTAMQSYVLTVLDVNDAPEIFTLLEPVHGEILQLVFPPVPVAFHWEASTDPDPIDTVRYLFRLTGSNFDTTLTGLSDTSLSLDVMSQLRAAESYQWHVLATDGQLTTSSDTAKFFTSDNVLSRKENEKVLDGYALYQNYPNPFNPVTHIRYQLPEAGYVKVVVYDMLGRELKTLVDDFREAGYYAVIWDGRNQFGKTASSGVYLYRLTATSGREEKFNDINKMVLMR